MRENCADRKLIFLESLWLLACAVVVADMGILSSASEMESDREQNQQQQRLANYNQTSKSEL